MYVIFRICDLMRRHYKDYRVARFRIKLPEAVGPILRVHCLTSLYQFLSFLHPPFTQLYGVIAFSFFLLSGIWLVSFLFAFYFLLPSCLNFFVALQNFF